MADPNVSCSRLKTAIAERCQEIVGQTDRWLEDHDDFVKNRLPRGTYNPRNGPNTRKLRYGFAPAEEREYLPILSEGAGEGSMFGRGCDGTDGDHTTQVDNVGAYGCELPGQELQGGYDVFTHELKGKAFETGYACAMDLLLKESYNDYLSGLAKAIKREAVKHHCWQLEREVINNAKYNCSVVDGFAYSSNGHYQAAPTGGLNFETVVRMFALLKAEGWSGRRILGGVSREGFEFMTGTYRDQKGYLAYQGPQERKSEFVDDSMEATDWNGITWVFNDFPTRGYLVADGAGAEDINFVRPTITRAGDGGGVVPDVNESYYNCRYYCEGSVEELYEVAYAIHEDFANVLSFSMPQVAGKSWGSNLFNLDLKMIDGPTVTNRFGVNNTDNFKFFLRALHAFSFEIENPELAGTILYKVSPHSPISLAPTCTDGVPGPGDDIIGIVPSNPQQDDGERDCADHNDASCGAEVVFPVDPLPTQEAPCGGQAVAGVIKWVDCGPVLTYVDAGTLRVCVERAGGSLGAAGCSLVLVDGTAAGGTDFTAHSIETTTCAWDDGEAGVKCLDITIDPTGAGGGKAFTAELSIATGAGVIDTACDDLTITIE